MQMMPPTALAEPGPTIDAQELRSIHAGLVQASRGIADRVGEELGIDDLAEVEIAFTIHLPEAHAGPAAEALSSLDLAWRLAWLAVERETSELEEYGTVYLDELLPLERTGLLIEAIELGSLRVRLQSARPSLERASATLVALAALSTIGGNAYDVVSAEAHRPDQAPCSVRVVGDLDQPARRLIEKQRPGLPPSCMVETRIELDDDTHLIVRVPADALR